MSLNIMGSKVHAKIKLYLFVPVGLFLYCLPTFSEDVF